MVAQPASAKRVSFGLLKLYIYGYLNEPAA
jgi:hypothetical protein